MSGFLNFVRRLYVIACIPSALIKDPPVNRAHLQPVDLSLSIPTFEDDLGLTTIIIPLSGVHDNLDINQIASIDTS